MSTELVLTVGATKTASRLIFVDTETCGLHGFVVLIQYAIDDGEIILHDVWQEPVEKTLRLIESFCEGTVIMFNSAFDWFHLQKCYNVFSLLQDKSALPNIREVASVEKQGRDGDCLKPLSTIDLFLYARKGPYQSTMERGDISIRRVPSALSSDLASELESRVKLNDIYFARRKDVKKQWVVRQSKDRETKEVLEGFDDVILEFAPSSALKSLAVDALKIPMSEVVVFEDISVDKQYQPVEYGYAPFAPDEFGGWPDVIWEHIIHWTTNSMARYYAAKDIDYLRRLYHFFECPPADDDDSVLACAVASTRWKGFAVDVPALKNLLIKTRKEMAKAPRAPEYVKRYLTQVMHPTEAAMLHDTTKNTLAAIAQWTVTPEDYVCAFPHLHTLDNAGVSCSDLHETPTLPHPAATRAKQVIAARSAEKECEIYEKLIKAGRFHASFKVIGALSGRMSGADDLNPQGIKGVDYVREAFLLAFINEILSGGDFKAFEVSLAEAEYKDPKLREDLLSGKKFGGLFAEFLFPDMTYDEIMETEHTGDDKYKIGKSGGFALVYGGDENTLHNKQGIPIDIATKAMEGFERRYQGVTEARKKVFEAFCPMIQPVPHGPVIWKEPAEYIESMFGFRRYFTLENMICKALFNLAKTPPKSWKEFKSKVCRRDRMQTFSGAAQSALYGAAFGLQAANMRAAANHRIQSSGAQITKFVQRRIWDLQPSGAHPWVVRVLNVHDELQAVTATLEIAQKVAEVVKAAVETFREKVPLIGIDWKVGIKSWAEKSIQVHK